MTKKIPKFFDVTSISFRCHHGGCGKRMKRQFKCWRCFMTFCQKHSHRPFDGERICFNCEREQSNRIRFERAGGLQEARERAAWEAEHDEAGASQDIYGW